MFREWHELTAITKGQQIIVERVRFAGTDVAVEGNFELPPLVRLSSSDQIFIMAFIKCHGSIKEMERIFGISYPTVKNRLDRISKQLDFVEIVPQDTKEDTLNKLESGEIDASEAIERLSK
jgi:hypothetical protein